MIFLKKLLPILAVSLCSMGVQAQNPAPNSDSSRTEDKPKIGLFVEPILTFESGDNSVDFPIFNNSTGTVKGFGLGARLGFHLSEVVFIGADGRYSMPQFTNSANNYDAKAVATSIGPMIGFQMPDIGLRIFGSYILDGQLDPETSNSVDIKFNQAKGYRIGAGFHVWSFSLNLEYQDVKYDNSTIENVGSSGLTTDSFTLQNKSWILGVSFPIEL